MDLIVSHKKEKSFEQRKKEVEGKAGNFKVECFPTNIFDVSLYKAWTTIMNILILDYENLQEALKNFAIACQAEEVLLFEKNSFLLTCHYSSNKIFDDKR